MNKKRCKHMVRLCVFIHCKGFCPLVICVVAYPGEIQGFSFGANSRLSEKSMLGGKRMGEIKISTSERLDKILQEMADDLGIKKAELVKNMVVNNLLERRGK
jgi:hypothetical protein